MSIDGRIIYVSSGRDIEMPYLINPVGFKDGKPYGKGIIEVSMIGSVAGNLLEAMIDKYDLPAELALSEAAWYLTSRKMERLIKILGYTKKE